MNIILAGNSGDWGFFWMIYRRFNPMFIQNLRTLIKEAIVDSVQICWLRNFVSLNQTIHWWHRHREKTENKAQTVLVAPGSHTSKTKWTKRNVPNGIQIYGYFPIPYMYTPHFPTVQLQINIRCSHTYHVYFSIKIWSESFQTQLSAKKIQYRSTLTSPRKKTTHL